MSNKIISNSINPSKSTEINDNILPETDMEQFKNNPSKRFPRKEDRNNAIWEDRNTKGYTFLQIAFKYNISHSRVGAILKSERKRRGLPA